MRKIAVGLVLLAAAVLTGLPVATSTFLHSERHLTIGAHQAVVSPQVDGHATIDFGPLLPEVRVPVDAPLGVGVNVRLGDSDAVGLEELLQRDAAIAAQPSGEVREVTAAVTDMAAEAALRGLGVGVLTVTVLVLGWRAVGADRRRRIRREMVQPSRGQVAGGVATVVVVVGALVLVSLPERQDAEPAQTWTAAREVFPELPADPVLDRLQLAQGSATTSSRALVEGALYLYRDSVSFYGALEEQATQVRVREPEDGETTALVVTDRHDNIGMDPVARNIADRAKARLLIDLGDDTSQGGAWETFSINSLARAFKGFDVVSIGGNHDSRRTTKDQEKAGFTVLDGDPVEVDGVRFLGDTDPRGTTLTGYTEDAKTRDTALDDQDEELTSTACDADERGERVGVLAVDPSSVRTGGSVLGDKTRMAQLAVSPQAYIRPSPSAGTLGGVARATSQAMTVLEAAGYDVVLVETVGVGQSEITVAGMVDTFLFLTIARTGDQLQGIKKGILEIADVIAVNKADGERAREAEVTAKDLAGALRLVYAGTQGWVPPVVTCSALEHQGIDTVWNRLVRHREFLGHRGLREKRAQQQLDFTWALVRDELDQRLRTDEGVARVRDEVREAVLSGELPAASAADLILEAYDQ